MAYKVNKSPTLPSPINLNSFVGIGNFLTQLINSLLSEFRDHAFRLNTAVMADGSEIPTAPIMLKTYVKSALPDPLIFLDGIIIVSNDIGGLTLAFSDGINWRRVQDRAVIS